MSINDTYKLYFKKWIVERKGELRDSNMMPCFNKWSSGKHIRGVFCSVMQSGQSIDYHLSMQSKVMMVRCFIEQCNKCFSKGSVNNSPNETMSEP